MIDPLEQALSELALRSMPHDIPLIIGGGYGLVLRIRQIRENRIRTLRTIPDVRSTQDLDLFLEADLLIDETRITILRDIIYELGYQAAQGAEYYQFSRTVVADGIPRTVKIDLLAPLPLDTEQRKLLKHDKRRVRPRNVSAFHAHTVPEACSVGHHAVPVDLNGGGRVYLPHPFSYAVLKLFALRDRIGDSRKEMGRYHAFDLYTILAMITESQWEEAIRLRDNFPDPAVSREAGSIVHGLFGDIDGEGMLAMRHHALSLGITMGELDLSEFIRDLHELFPR